MQQSECEVVVKERKKECGNKQKKERKQTKGKESVISGFTEKYSAVVQELKRLLEHWQRNQDQKKDLTVTIVVVYLCVETGSGMME